MTPGIDPEYVGDTVRVQYDLAAGRIVVWFPPYVDETGETVAAMTIDMSPAEAVEVAGGIVAVGISAANGLLEQRNAASLTARVVGR